MRIVEIWKKEDNGNPEIKKSFIKVDGINIKELGLTTLRSKLSIIP